MYNSNIPSRAELPSSRQLLRSTAIAAAVACVLLITVVFPAEYGKDWTGIGRVLGLTRMGEIKAELAKEAAADAAADASAAIPSAVAATPPVATPVVASTTAPDASSLASWRDELTFTLAPGQGIEIKLVMKEGEKAAYAWTVEGGVVNHDTHGDGGGRSISYAKGRGVPADTGELVAAFSGNHGWFWRNRGKQDVRLVLRTGGQYSELKRAM